MPKRLIVAAIIFGIASSAGLSVGIRSAFAFDNAVIGENDRVVLHGTIHPKARPEFDVGPTDPSLPMNRTILLLKIAPEKQAELDRLVAEQLDRSSPNFHRWLTPEEFGKRFGRSPEEISSVEGWLITHGFTIDETVSSTSKKGGTRINFSGTAAAVDSAFHANMHDYQVDGRLRHANSTDISIPRGLADLVAGPVSLHNFPHKAMHTPPRHMPETKSQPGYTESGGVYALAPGDFAIIYDVNRVYNMGYDGTGVTIAVVNETLPPNAIAKWNLFRSTFGLPYNPPVVTVNGPPPGDQGSDYDQEADLDVEWSGAVATGATINFVTSASTNATDGADLSAEYVVDNNVAPIMSDSFALCERDLLQSGSTFYYNLWEQAVSQGITVFVPSGDSGAYGCTGDNGSPLAPRAVNGLASTPFNIAVGGTSFSASLSDPSAYWSPVNSTDEVSALGYVPEVAWNNWVQYDLPWASGGGASAFWPKPAWQVCPGVPKDGHRDMPDVSLDADPYTGYRVYTCTNGIGFCTSNEWSTIAGTSGGSPAFAGIMALIVQSMGGEPQGNFNNAFYQLGNAQYSGTSGASPVFHDITSGNNGFGAQFPGYSCTANYNQVTGLGSVDAYNLLLALQETGSLTVTIGPAAAVTAGAMWNVDNGSWNANGATVPGLSAGSHTVNFGSIPGWNTPASQTAVIPQYGPIKATGTYVLAALTVESFLIDNGAGTTPGRTVTLNNTVNGLPAAYMASQSSTFTGAAWKPYSAAPSFTLSAANGQKTVYFKVKNAGGVSAEANASIVLAQLPAVTSFKIDAGAATTINPVVTLNNTATISPTQFMASEDPSFTEGVLQGAYSTAPKFTLSPGGGTKTVYFQVQNSAGQSPAVSDTIQLIVPPILQTFQINGGVTPTSSRTVTLNNTTTGGTPTYYMASQSSTFAGAAWKPYSTAPSFTLSAAKGNKTVYFKAKNAAGASNVLNAGITLD